MVKWVLVGIGVLLILCAGVLMYFMGGPADAYGFLRFALPQWNKGELRAGDKAKDVELLTLDGKSRFHLQERIGARPLVLIFGSYT